MSVVPAQVLARTNEPPTCSGEFLIDSSPANDFGSGAEADDVGPPESRPSAWKQCSADYQVFAEGLTRPFARDAVRLVHIGSGTRVLDVATGTGEFALAAAQRSANVLATDFCPTMLRLLERTCAEKQIRSVDVAVMDGQALALPDQSFDVAASLFGLVFFPDPAQGLSEMRRVLAPGGRAVIGTWAPPPRVELMRLIAEAVMAAGIETPEPSTVASDWASMSSPRRLTQLLESAGFTYAYAIEVAHVWTFQRIDAVAEAVLRMTPAWMQLHAAMSAQQRSNFASALADGFRRRQGVGPFAVTASGLLAVGTKA